MKRQTMTWQSAKARVQPFAETGAAWAAAAYGLRFAAWAVMGWLGMSENALFCIFLETAMLAPLEAERVRWMGSKLGVLDECDRGFLRCSGKLWVWRRWWGIKISMAAVMMLSCIPMAAMFAGAWKLLGMMPFCTDGTWVMAIGVHFGIAGVLMAAFPMRAAAMNAVLPMIFMKVPHWRTKQVLLAAYRLTKGDTWRIMRRRLVTFPLCICPLTVLKVAPVLWAAEYWESGKRLSQSGYGRKA